MQIKFNYLSLSLQSTVSLWIVSHLTFKIQSKTNYFYKNMLMKPVVELQKLN